MVPVVPGAPVAADGVVRFAVVDADHSFAAVWLRQELARPYDGPELAWRDGVWSVDVATRGALRMEYLLVVRHHDNRVDTGPDPANPRRAPGSFGEKSVVELPEYRPPSWLRDAVPPDRAGALREAIFPSKKLGHPVRAFLWTSAGAADCEPLPLLVAHDGPELVDLAGLLTYLDVAVSHRTLPPMRAALLAPGERDEEYSASAAYADALALEVLPGILARLPSRAGARFRVGMGASLGALAMLHAHRRRPDLFGGLFLQSGSFFQRRTDSQESGFRRFPRINRFVHSVLTDPGPAPVPITVRLTCGTVEENLANNQAMAAALAGQGYAVTLGQILDGHNWVSWRDAFDDHLRPLLNALWDHRSEHVA